MQLKADMVIGEITEEEIGDDWFTEDMAKEILKTVGESASEEVKYSISPDAPKILANAINRLTFLYKNEEGKILKTQNNLSQYPVKDWGDFIYQKNEKATWEEIFHICTDILDIIRTGNLDNPLKAVIYSTDKNTGITKIYIGNERDLDVSIYQEKTKSGEITRESLIYTITDAKLKLTELNSSNLFAQHYLKLKKAIETRKDLEPIKQRLENKTINEGHIIESYQRHLYFQHNIKNLDSDTILNFKENENIPTKIIAINLYYSINSDPWFSGGDVGLMQIKGTNRRLASLMSVKMVASKIFELVKHRQNFNVEDFRKLFTQDDLNNMIKEDPQNIGKKTIKELVNSIGTKTTK